MRHLIVNVEDAAELLDSHAYGAGALLRWEWSPDGLTYTEGGTVALVSGTSEYDVWHPAGIASTEYRTRVSDSGGTLASEYSAPAVRASHYSTPAKVLTRTGTDPGDLGFADDEDLTAFVEELLEEIADLMNQKLGRDYCALLDDGTITAIPKGLSGIAADIGADCLRTMVATRGSAVVRIDDFAVATVRARVFSDDILERLRLYGHHGVRSVTMSNR